MKKYRFLSLHFMVVVLFLVLLFVQSKAQVHYGVRAGVQLSNASVNLSTGVALEDLFGLTGGAFIYIPISSIFAIQPEVLYTTKGFSLSSSVNASGVSATSKAKLTLQYLEIPILAKFHFLESTLFQPYLLAGPSIGFWLSGSSALEASVTVNGKTTSETKTVNATNQDINSIEVGLMGGVGVEYKLTASNRLSLDFRYSLGLTNISKPLSGNNYVKNNALCFWLGFSF